MQSSLISCDFVGSHHMTAVHCDAEEVTERVTNAPSSVSVDSERYLNLLKILYVIIYMLVKEYLFVF